jgi:DNA-binding SARP family transcriptional activator
METRAASCDAGSISVEATTGTVRRNGVPLRLSARERECAVAIAVQPRPVSPKDLAALLYPDRDADAAARAVKVYVHRVRRRVGRAFVEFGAGGYALALGVQVDVHQAQRALTAAARGARIERADREELLRIARRLRAEPPASFGDAPWFEPLAARGRRLGHDLALALARTMTACGELRDAICIAQELTYDDPCDEEAWELLIRSYLSTGERGAALSGLRYYESVLATEFNASPPRYMRELVEAGRHAAAG